MAVRINIDFETRSMVDLRKSGVYPYAEHPSTDVWCMAYAIDGGPVKVWSPFLPEPAPHLAELTPLLHQGLLDALPGAELRAWNSGFECVIWREIMVKRYGFPAVETEQWVDTAAEAAALALPRGLGNAALVLGLDVDKDEEGRKLMMKMSRPRTVGAWWNGGLGPFATKAEAKLAGRGTPVQDSTTVVWWDDPLMLRRLIDYCKQDVTVEHAVMGALRRLRPSERQVFLMNQRMNDRGVYVDMDLVRGATEVMEIATDEANLELARLTKGMVSKVSQVAALRDWVNANSDLGLDNLRKDTIRDLLKTELPANVRKVLQLREDFGKTSTAKLDSFERVVAADGRAHGMLVYHGASTGRWSGALVQPQNFPRPTLDPEPYIEAMTNADIVSLKADLGDTSVGELTASMLRSMMMAAPGNTLIAADYSQIEARVLAWVAGQQDLVDLFADGGKIYETMAAFIFGKKVEEIAKDSFERQIGKNSVLGAGFQMGADRYAEQVREQTGIILERDRHWKCEEHGVRGKWDVDNVREFRCGKCRKKLTVHQGPNDLAAQAIAGYRTLYSKIPQFWKDIEAAALQAVRHPGEVFEVGVGATIKYTYRSKFLWCQLPSGRFLTYARPIIKTRPLPAPWEHKFKESLSYYGVNSLTRQWTRQYTYGGHLTENVVQAMARDLMAGAMLRVEHAGYSPILTVHDEVVVEADAEDADFSQFMELMQVLPRWATGLPVAAEGWQGQRYRK